MKEVLNAKVQVGFNMSKTMAMGSSNNSVDDIQDVSLSTDLGLMTGFDQWSVDRSHSISVPNLGLKKHCFQLPP